MSKTRYFYPVDPNYVVIIGGRPTGIRGCIHHWEWTRRKGLVAILKDGRSSKSEWTLREFLKAVKEGRETQVSEIGGVAFNPAQYLATGK